MLKVKDITFSYRRKSAPVLQDLSMTVGSGGVYGLLGSNGVGKSTLLYIISGLLKPDSGEVIFKGTDVRHHYPSVMSDIFIVPEEFTLPAVSLMDYVKANSPFYPNFSEADMRSHLDIFGMDSDVNLGRLSMGQKKKVFMCFALACNTSLLLMDEPTNGLDIPGKRAFRSFIGSNMADDRSVIISTHQVRDIDRLLDHVVIMDKGSVLLNSSVMQITERLKFTVTDNRSLIGSALLAQPALGGTAIVAVNDDGEETDINLETLFQLALDNPEILKKIFNINE